MPTNMTDVLKALKTVLEEEVTLLRYNNVVLYYPLIESELPISGKFVDHCIVLWPQGEPEEEERIGKRADVRFNIEVTAIVKGGFSYEESLLGKDDRSFIGILDFIGDLKSLLRFNTLDSTLTTQPGGNIREVDYIKVPETNAIKARFIFTGYVRQAV